MRSLPGDMETADQGIKNLAEQGIKKTTDIDITGISERSSRGSRGSPDLGEAEKGLRNTDFF